MNDLNLNNHDHNPADCGSCNAMAVRDALDVLSGKWKLQIMLALSKGATRFKQVAKEVPGITDKMLSKELKDLEVNHLVKRDVLPTFPPTVDYTLTNHGKTLDRVIMELSAWGIAHRNEIFGRQSTERA